MLCSDFLHKFCLQHFSFQEEFNDVSYTPIPVAVRSKAWVCGSSLAWIVSSNPAGEHGCLYLESVVCCHVGVSATNWSLVQRSPTNCDMIRYIC
jgi:hypothetical protein